MGDLFQFFFDLAKSFFKAFAYAVQEYPLPTAVVFILAAIVYFERYERRREHDPLFALIVFILGVIAANVIGWIFHKALAILQWLLGWTEIWTGLFSKNPIAFLLSLIVGVGIGYLYLCYHYGIRLRGAPILSHGLIAFLALFAAYVFTNIYVQVAG
jgi:ABC-type sugar transport system permease subunit